MAENTWASLGENIWPSMGENPWPIIARKMTIPYCELAVMERDLCNILGQIKRNHSIRGV